MATVVRSTLRTILPVIRTKLVTDEVATLEQIRVVRKNPRNIKNLLGTYDLLFHLGSERPDEEGMDANGRHDMRVIRRLDVWCRTRLQLDVGEESYTWWTNADEGHAQLEDAVIDSLHLYWPIDSDSNALGYEPLRYRGISEAFDYGDTPGWGASAITFEIYYIRDLTNADRSY